MLTQLHQKAEQWGEPRNQPDTVDMTGTESARGRPEHPHGVTVSRVAHDMTQAIPCNTPRSPVARARAMCKLAQCSEQIFQSKTVRRILFYRRKSHSWPDESCDFVSLLVIRAHGIIFVVNVACLPALKVAVDQVY